MKRPELQQSAVRPRDGLSERPRKRAKSAATVQRRVDILAAALRLLEERKIGDITMTEVAKAASISRSALYFHFPNTLEIYRAASRQMVIAVWEHIWAQAKKYQLSGIDEITDMIIEVSVGFVNSSQAVGKTFMGKDPRFHILGWSEEYNDIVYENFKALMEHYKCEIPRSLDESFHTVSLTVAVVFRDEYQRHGHISRDQAEKLKRILRGNIAFAITGEVAPPVVSHAGRDAAAIWSDVSRRVLAQDASTIVHLADQIEGMLTFLDDRAKTQG